MTHLPLRTGSRRAHALGLALALLLTPVGNVALAASSWNPTVLVNTESFQTIDEGDGNTNVEVRFGQTLNETLIFNRTTGRFEFSDDLTVRGNLSGSTLTVDNLKSCDTIDTDANGNLTCGTDSTGPSQSDNDARYVNTSGDSMTGTLIIKNNAGLNASGSILTNTNLTINSDNGAADAIITFGNDTLAETLRFNRTNSRFEFSDDVYVQNNFEVDGTAQFDGATTINAATTINSTLDTTGLITTDSNLTINEDNTDADAILTFGNDAGVETVRFNNTTNNFAFSDDVDVTGNVRATGYLSGSSLTVDGNLTWRGQTYVGPSSQSANTFLKTDGSGNLTWSTISLGNGSGNLVSLHPEYPGATYFASGSTAVGTMTYSYDATNKQNYYRWTTSKGTLQDYWTAVRVQIPKNFAFFESSSGVTVRLRTTTTSAANNYVTVRVYDTTGTAVAVSNNADLRSSSANVWRNVPIGNVQSGTYTPGGYITILIKTAATTTNTVDLGSIDLRWSITTP